MIGQARIVVSIVRQLEYGISSEADWITATYLMTLCLSEKFKLKLISFRALQRYSNSATLVGDGHL